MRPVVPAVDLYLVHSPLRTDARLETWAAMEDLLKTEKCRAIGVSNYGIHHLEELFKNSTVRPAVNQVWHTVLPWPNLVLGNAYPERSPNLGWYLLQAFDRLNS